MSLLSRPTRIEPVNTVIERLATLSMQPKAAHAIVSQNEHTEERSFKMNVRFTGSLDDSTSLQRTINDGAMAKVLSQQGIVDSGGAPLRLDRMSLTEISAHVLSNNWPVDLVLNCGKAEHQCGIYDETGEKAPVSIPARQISASPAILYENRSILSDSSRAKFGFLKDEEIREGGAYGPAHCLYPIDHPLVTVMLNHPVSYPTSQIQRIGDHYKIPTTYVNSAETQLKNEVLDKYQFDNISGFKMQLTRADGRPLNDKTGTEFSHYHDREATSLAGRTYNATIQMGFKVAVPKSASGPVINLNDKSIVNGVAKGISGPVIGSR